MQFGRFFIHQYFDSTLVVVNLDRECADYLLIIHVCDASQGVQYRTEIFVDVRLNSGNLRGVRPDYPSSLPLEVLILGSLYIEADDDEDGFALMCDLLYEVLCVDAHGFLKGFGSLVVRHELDDALLLAHRVEVSTLGIGEWNELP